MLVRRRYYTWLLKAYVKRWKNTILYSVVGGILIFFLGFALFNFYLIPLLQKKVQRIGVAGAHTVRNLPEPILEDMSYGLTQVDETGRVKPKAATRWEIKQSGKEYIFYLKPGQYFHNGDELTAYNLNLNFKDVEKKVINPYTVSYTLSTPYVPFLVSASKPLFIKNFIGLGDYKVKKIELNAGFVKSLTLQGTKETIPRKIIYFYPTKDALNTAFALGEIDYAQNLLTLRLDDTHDLSTWKNVAVEKKVNYDELVLVFYNNADSELSNKKLRQALNYAVPEKFSQGERAYSSIPPASIYFSKSPNFGISDMEIAKQLLKSSQVDSNKVFEITTTEEFVDTATILQKRWEELGIKTKVSTVSELPDRFQILVYQIRLPKDPDQYTLWHSDQVNNIAHFKNLRIDKLLEDGRVTLDENKRQLAYADFQKYLIDEVPASFLYFPYEFSVTRR